MLIKYIKSVLWRVAKRLSYIEEARCLKVNRWRLDVVIVVVVVVVVVVIVVVVVGGGGGGGNYETQHILVAAIAQFQAE